MPGAYTVIKSTESEMRIAMTKANKIRLYCLKGRLSFPNFIFSISSKLENHSAENYVNKHENKMFYPVSSNQDKCFYLTF